MCVSVNWNNSYVLLIIFAMPLYCERAAISGLIKCFIFLHFFLQNKHPYQAVSYSKENRICSPCFFLFVCGFTSHSRILHSFGDKNYRWRACNVDLYSAFSTIEQWVSSYPCHTYRNTRICSKWLELELSRSVLTT